MSFHFKPAKRVNTPLVIGIAGPTKSGKTYSAHRIAVGLAQGGTIAMVNAEGPKGHQYSERFSYLATDIGPPYRPKRYSEALKDALALEPAPAVLIIDSMSHMHNGPGGMLEYHEDELDRLAGQDMKARQRSTWSAWVKPKADENAFVYEMLDSPCHMILCFRAKEKLKIIRGQEPIDLGWQPIASEQIAFETLFTLMLPPHSKGVPDLAISEMREPFDSLMVPGQQLDEQLGERLAKWAAGGSAAKKAPPAVTAPESPQDAGGADLPNDGPVVNARQVTLLWTTIRQRGVSEDDVRRIVIDVTGQDSTKAIPARLFETVLAKVQAVEVPVAS